ncbi:platelet-derived growth factor receptor alpha-like [Orbicella faveolata]|uniref:platelet-derived growth factor receptor alpha-like n=1 Tax=Orbicella faveolata TaxID=48498 RepID=UPI0009E36C6E|nr:platelet-derived growth factor receptor alpha-like [Orbicella faveolata]
MFYRFLFVLQVKSLKCLCNLLDSNSQTLEPDHDVEAIELQNWGSSSYTDSGRATPTNEPFDLTPQEYSVIPPVLPNASEKNWEIPRESLVFVKVIGKGAFGKVAKGMATGIDNSKESRLVAIKMLRKNATDENRQDLLSELNLMKNLEPHQNVIQLLGCVTKTDPVMAITEYAPYGDLLGYLRKSRGLHDTYYKDPDFKPQSSLRSKQLFGFALGIANGMEFLSSKKIVHRDLAARNVLVGDGEVCKITDFGLARNVFQEDLYRRTATGRLPVKWTAFESLVYGICTTMSDIWSYGIVMYEIFTIGGSPYPKIDVKALASLLQEGYRMPRPPHLDEKLYEVMSSCWNEKPEERPSFSKLRKIMKAMGNKREIYINLKDYDSQLYQNVDDMDA